MRNKKTHLYEGITKYGHNRSSHDEHITRISWDIYIFYLKERFTKIHTFLFWKKLVINLPFYLNAFLFIYFLSSCSREITKLYIAINFYPHEMNNVASFVNKKGNTFI